MITRTMGSSIPAGSVVDSAALPPQRPGRIRRRKRRVQPSVKYFIAFATLVALAIGAQFVVHMARTDPRDTRAIAERELQLNTLQSGEQAIRTVSV
ncbi:MAG: hypothetical protein ACREPM_23950, partial [Gemmatimonadaceae bacterium]